MHCNLRLLVLDVAPIILGCFWPTLYCACAQAAAAISDQNHNTTIKVNDPNFLKNSNNLAIKRRSHAVTLTFNAWPWTFVACLVTRDCNTYQIQYTAKLLIILKIFVRITSHCTSTFHHVTLNFSGTTSVMWSNYVPNMNENERCSAELQQFKDLKFGFGLHLGFHGSWTSILVWPSQVYNTSTYQTWAKLNNMQRS